MSNMQLTKSIKKSKNKYKVSPHQSGTCKHLKLNARQAKNGMSKFIEIEKGRLNDC